MTRKKENIVFSYLLLISVLLLFLVCTKSSSPSQSASIGNNGNIVPLGKAIVDSVFGLYISAQGDGNLSYKWIKDESDDLGVNNDTVLFNPLRLEDGGRYTCIAANEFGIDTSLSLIVNVFEPASILKHPKSKNLAQGDSVSFFVSIKGTIPFSIQWFKKGMPIVNATDSIYTLSNITLGDSGAPIQCKVSNQLGSDLYTSMSDTAVLLVSSQIIKPSVINEPKHMSILAGQRARFTIAATGTDALTYQWQKDEKNIIGATDTSYETPMVTLADSGTLFRCVVFNRGGSDTSLSALLTVTSHAMAPQIITQPQDKKSRVGETVTFAVSASGTSPLTFQWHRNSSVLIGDTVSILTLPSVSLVNSDSLFWCAVSNTLGGDTSRLATLTVRNSNYPPEWIHDTMFASIHEGATFTIFLPDSCEDVEGDSLFFTLDPVAPLSDSITIERVYRLTPTFSEAGEYVIPIWAHDAIDSSRSILHMTIIDKNRVPQFKDSFPMDIYRIKGGDLLSVPLAAIDLDSDTLSFFLYGTDLPRHQTVSVTDTQLTWQSQHSDTGVFQTIVGVHDIKDSVYCTLSVEVNTNLPPVLTVGTYVFGDTIRIKEQVPFSCTVSASDPDPGQQARLLPGVRLPDNCSYDTATGQFAYTADHNIATIQTSYLFSDLSFFATDDVSRTIDSFVIHLEVLDSNRAPFCNDTTITAREGNNRVVNLFASDPDQNDLTWQSVQGPKFGKLNVTNGTIQRNQPECYYRANELTAGNMDTLVFTISDSVDSCRISVFVTILAKE